MARDYPVAWGGIAGSTFFLVMAGGLIAAMGFATPAWNVWGDLVDGRSTEQGLWQTCSCARRTSNDDDWLKASQAMITVGLAAVILAFLLALIYMVVGAGRGCTIIVVFVLCLLSAAFLGSGLAVYVFKINKDNLHYSFWLVAVAACLVFLASILSCFQMRRTRDCC